MNTHEACALLGVPIGASDVDVKAAFKKKAIEYHPDRNKSPDAETKFKEINEAFQLLEKFGANPPAVGDVRSPFYNTADHLADEIKRQMDEVFYTGKFRRVGPPIVINVEIPFEMSIVGGKKEISYNHLVKCHMCTDGKAKGPCQKCNGTGRRRYGSGTVTPTDNRELPCNACVGTGVSKTGICGSCMGTSKRQIVDTILVRFQPGIHNGTILTLNGKGNYSYKDFYDDLIIEVAIQPSKNGLTLNGDDVISTVELSLLEALQGTKKNLQTIKGEKVLEFKPKVRNGDRIRVSGFGIPPNGAHIFVISITYPEDVSELIAVLEKNKPPPPDTD